MDGMTPLSGAPMGLFTFGPAIPLPAVCPRRDASDARRPQSGRHVSGPRGITTNLIGNVVRPLASRGLEVQRSFHGAPQSRTPLLRRVVKPLPVGAGKHA